MTHLAFWIGVWGGAATGFTLTALITTYRLRARAKAAAMKPTMWPKIALVRPCEGLDPSLAETLRSSVTARYDGPRTIFFCVPSARDPGVRRHRARARRARRPRGADVRWSSRRSSTPANRKAAQLAVVDAHAARSTRAHPRRRRLRRAARRRVAAVADERALDRSRRRRRLGAAHRRQRARTRRRSLVGGAAVVDAARAAGAGGAVGALGRRAAPRRRAAGGQARGARRRRWLPLARAVSRRRLRARAPPARRRHERWRRRPAPARFTDSGRSLRGIVRRYARWSLVVRRQRPALFATYVLLLGCTPLVSLAALLAAAARADGWPLALGATAALVAARTLLALTLRRCYGVAGGWARALAAMLAGELLILRRRDAGRRLGRGRVARPPLLRRRARRARARPRLIASQRRKTDVCSRSTKGFPSPKRSKRRLPVPTYQMRPLPSQRPSLCYRLQRCERGRRVRFAERSSQFWLHWRPKDDARLRCCHVVRDGGRLDADRSLM